VILMPRPRGPRSRRTAAVTLLIAFFVACVTGAQPAQAAARLVPVSGVGSSWSSIAITQWASNVNRLYQMQIAYDASGSSNGRKQFGGRSTDFGVSEIPYGLTDGGVYDAPPARAFAYMPIVAGGTSFMYNLKVGGKQVTQLRLSGDNIAKIFTGVITNWSDPLIKADNPGLTLPARKVVPVVRSDGSGTTAQFTTWMSKRYAAIWDAYCTKAGRSTPCGVTSIYPSLPGVVIAQANSTGVAGYVQQSTSEGAITYVEYGYAKQANFPVVSLLNKSGYYIQPTSKNVAVGLLGATINKDTSNPATYLTQILDGVYDNADPRAYPLSSYSYMILPTKLETPLTTDKGYTLGKFGYYFLCEGQRSVDDLGYSALPLNLVQAGLEQLAKVPGVVPEDIDITKCNNPTFSSTGANTLATTAPQPLACQKQGPTQCDTTATGAAAGTGTGAAGSAAGGAAAGGAAAGGAAAGGVAGAGAGAAAAGSGVAGAAVGGAAAGGSAAGKTVAGAAGAGAGAAGAGAAGSVAGGGTAVDPDTGQVLPAAGAAGASGAAGVAAGQQAGAASPGGQQVLAGGPQSVSLPVSLASDATGGAARTALMMLSVVLLLGVAVAPPLVAHWAQRKRRSS